MNTIIVNEPCNAVLRLERSKYGEEFSLVFCCNLRKGHAGLHKAKTEEFMIKWKRDDRRTCACCKKPVIEVTRCIECGNDVCVECLFQDAHFMTYVCRICANRQFREILREKKVK